MDVDTITLNVGGRKFETMRQTLLKYPQTQIAMIVSQDPNKREYFFDRNPDAFQVVLDFFRTGQINTPPTVGAEAVRQELVWWGLQDVVKSAYGDNISQSVSNVLVRDEEPEFVESKQSTKLLDKSSASRVETPRSMTGAEYVPTQKSKLVTMMIVSILFTVGLSIGVVIAVNKDTDQNCNVQKLCNFDEDSPDEPRFGSVTDYCEDDDFLNIYDERGCACIDGYQGKYCDECSDCSGEECDPKIPYGCISVDERPVTETAVETDASTATVVESSAGLFGIEKDSKMWTWIIIVSIVAAILIIALIICCAC